MHCVVYRNETGGSALSKALSLATLTSRMTKYGNFSYNITLNTLYSSNQLENIWLHYCMQQNLHRVISKDFYSILKLSLWIMVLSICNIRLEKCYNKNCTANIHLFPTQNVKVFPRISFAVCSIPEYECMIAIYTS